MLRSLLKKGITMNKKMKKMLIALSVVFGGIILFNLFKGFMMHRFFANFTPPAITVSSVTAKNINWEPHINAVGNFVAINGVDVNSQASGNVVAIHFDSGQYVEANKPLIDIDDSVDEATLKSNQSNLSLQELSFNRQTDLFKKNATSKASVDEARAKLLQAEADVEKTKALISQKHITAPFAGQLGIRSIDLGQFITPGQTAIAALESMDPIYLNFYLPEQLFRHLHIEQNILFSVEQNKNLLFRGKISAINSKIDEKTHNIKVQATLANCPAKAIVPPYNSPLIKAKKEANSDKIIISCDSDLNAKAKIHRFTFIPGMFAAIEVEEPPIPNVIVLPTTAISYSLYGNSVYIIEKDKEKPEVLVVKRIFVNTASSQGNLTVITKGLKAGQQVVSSGEFKLQDGTAVVINNEVKLNENLDIDQLID